MKNYKMLVPVVLVVLFVASIFMAFDSNSRKNQEYQDYLTTARAYAEQGILVDAVENYELAMGVENSYALSMELVQLYLSNGRTDEAAIWCEDLIKKYPKNVEAYTHLMGIYDQNEDYIACFKLSDNMRQRKLSMDSVSEIMEKLNNAYFFLGQYENVSAFGNGFCAVQTKNLWGFVDEKGAKAVGTQFLKVGSFVGELAPVIDREGKAYFIDTQGNKKKVVLGVENVRELGLIYNGIFTLFDGKTWGLYNNDSRLIVGGFEEASMYVNGVFAAKKGGTWTLINGDGKQTSAEQYEDVVQDEKGIVYRCERLFAKINGKYYLIDQTGKKIGNIAFEDAELFCDPNSPYAAVKVDGKWGFIDVNGKYFIEPQYADARSFSGGFAAVMVEDKWGFIDMDKQVAIECTFSGAKDFTQNGCVFVRQDDDWQLLKLYRLNH